MSANLQVVCLYEEPTTPNQPSIFLAGCYHAGGHGVPSDLAPIAPLLDALTSPLTLYLPHERAIIESDSPLKPTGEPKWDEADWLKWEITMLDRADVAAFWMPRGVIDGHRPTGYLSSQEIRQVYLREKPAVAGWPESAADLLGDFQSIMALMDMGPLPSMEAVFRAALEKLAALKA